MKLACFYCLILLLLPGVVLAEEACDTAADADDLPTLKFAVPDVYPWGYTDDQGKLAGLFPRFLDYLQQKRGLKFNQILLPYSRLVHSLQNGSVDLAALMDDQSYDNVDYLAKLVSLDIMIITLADSPPLASLSDLAGKRVGYLRGWKNATNFYRQHDIEGVPMNTVNQGLALLLRRRIDAMTGTPYSIPLAVKSMGLDAKQLRNTFRLGIGSMSLYISKNSLPADELEKLRRGLDCVGLEAHAQEFFGDVESQAE